MPIRKKSAKLLKQDFRRYADPEKSANLIKQENPHELWLPFGSQKGENESILRKTAKFSACGGHIYYI